MAVRQQQRRGTAAQWTSANPILSPGEIGFEIDTNQFKIGDGTNRWATLIYFTADAAGAIQDLIDGAPGILDTLNELAAAVGDDANFFATVTANIASAKSEAISTASSDATTKANNAKSGAEATASAALDLKAPIASPTFTGTVAGITKSMVGLGDVDNTADSAKPVSTAQQTALNLKANLASPDLTGNPTAPTQPLGNDSQRIATTEFVKAAIQNISSLNLVLDGGGV